MKNNVVYIVLLIVTLTCRVMTSTIVSDNTMAADEYVATHTTESQVVDVSTIAFPDTQLCLSRTTAPIHIHISQQSNKRNDTDRRHNTTYLKSGKFIDTSVSFSIHNHSKLFSSILSEPYHRLISLGRLII